jgi:feruloyl-CoA synthase
MKGPLVEVERRADGSVLIASAHAPGNKPFTIAHLLADKAKAHPDRPYILQRAPGHGPWAGVSYGQAKRAADGIGQWLLDQGLGQAIAF